MVSLTKESRSFFGFTTQFLCSLSRLQRSEGRSGPLGPAARNKAESVFFPENGLFWAWRRHHERFIADVRLDVYRVGSSRRARSRLWESTRELCAKVGYNRDREQSTGSSMVITKRCGLVCVLKRHQKSQFYSRLSGE